MSLAQVGEPFDPADLVTLATPAAVVDAGVLRATVSYVDRYGNSTLAADEGAAADAGLRPGAPISIETSGGKQRAIYAITFGEVAEGELLMYVAASGGLALAVNQGNAAEQLGIAAGDEVVLGPA
jgi:S-adenosylmethionine hydrolase